MSYTVFLTMTMTDLLKYLGGGSEDETPRDGLLSSRREWHALVLGFFAGFIHGYIQSEQTRNLLVTAAAIILGSKTVNRGKLKQIQSEPWYAAAGIVVGLVAGYAFKTVTTGR